MTGYFKKDSKTGQWDFKCLNEKKEEQGKGVIFNHSLQVLINTDMEAKTLDASIISPVEAVAQNYWIYNKVKNVVIAADDFIKFGKSFDTLIKILDKDGTSELVNADNNGYVGSENTHGYPGYLRINDTTMNMLDTHIKNYLVDTNDFMAIKQNNIFFSKFRENEVTEQTTIAEAIPNDVVFDVVTIKGKVQEMIHRAGNYELVGIVDVLVLNLKDVKIINTEKFDFNKLPVLNYLSKQKLIENRVKSMPKDTVQKPLIDTIKTKQDTTAIKQDTTTKK